MGVGLVVERRDRTSRNRCRGWWCPPLAGSRSPRPGRPVTRPVRSSSSPAAVTRASMPGSSTRRGRECRWTRSASATTCWPGARPRCWSWSRPSVGCCPASWATSSRPATTRSAARRPPGMRPWPVEAPRRWLTCCPAVLRWATFRRALPLPKVPRSAVPGSGVVLPGALLPAAKPSRLRAWPGCWRGPSTPAPGSGGDARCRTSCCPVITPPSPGGAGTRPCCGRRPTGPTSSGARPPTPVRSTPATGRCCPPWACPMWSSAACRRVPDPGRAAPRTGPAGTGPAGTGPAGTGPAGTGSSAGGAAGKRARLPVGPENMAH